MLTGQKEPPESDGLRCGPLLEEKEVKEVTARLSSEVMECFSKRELCQNRFIPNATFEKGNAGLLGATSSGYRGLGLFLQSMWCLVSSAWALSSLVSLTLH